MRASRLMELLLLLQLRGRTTAGELAEALEVSVRTVHRDLEALAGAGVPVYTEVGRNGGVRLPEGYRVAGLPHLDDTEARGVLLAAVPAVAHDLGLDPAGAEDKLLTAMEAAAATAARSLRDRLLIEPEDWFRPREDVPFLLDVARAVWETRELRITYRSSAGVKDHRIRPLGLVLKGPVWYVLARAGDADRIYRVARITDATVLPHSFMRPDDFDLAAAWRQRTEEFMASIPSYDVSVRVAPAGERLLALLQEGTPPLPLAPDTARDEDGWALLRLRFERPESATRLLLQLGADVEVVEPAEVRSLMRRTARALSLLYS